MYCGDVSSLIGHPFDTYKVLLQNNNNFTKPFYSSLFNYKSKRNIFFLYRGMQIPFLLSTPLYTFGIFFYSKFFKRTPFIKNKAFYIGDLTGFVYSGIMTPIELIKINV